MLDVAFAGLAAHASDQVTQGEFSELDIATPVYKRLCPLLARAATPETRDLHPQVKVPNV